MTTQICGSKSFSLDNSDIKKILTNASLVGVSAFLTVIGQNLSSIDVGAYTPLIVPVVALIIDGLIKFIKNNTVANPLS